MTRTTVPPQFFALSVLRMIWKQKVYAVLVWAVVSVLGAAVVYRMEAIYKAETLILVDSQKIPDKYVATTVISDVQDRLATISQEMLSTTRLKRIIDDYKLYPEARKSKAPEEVTERMRGDVEVKLEKGWTGKRPGAFRIIYQGPNAATVAAVANRLAALYIDENLRVREDQATGTSEFLNEQLKDAKEKLDKLESAVSRYKLDHNGELPQQENSIAMALSRLQIELQGTHDALNRAQQNKLMTDAEINAARETLSRLTKPDDLMASESLPAARQPGAPVKRWQVVEAQLKSLRARYTDEHPEVRRLKRELEKEQAADTSMTSAPDTGAVAPTAPAPRQVKAALSVEAFRQVNQLSQRLSALRVQAALNETEVKDRTEDRNRIVREMSGYQAQLQRLPVREQEMAGLTRDYEISKSNYRSLLDKKLSADMATEMERRQKAERFTVLDPAQVPQKPVKPNRPVLASAISFAGIVLGLAVSIGKEWKRGLLLGEWELPCTVRVLGRVPQIRIAPDGQPPDGSHRRGEGRKN